MSKDEEPDRIVLALAHERQSYILSGRPDRVMPLDEQLALRGYCVDAKGQVVKLDEKPMKQESQVERADVEKPPEDTAEQKPKRRGRKPLPRGEDGNIVREDES
jgi:hypothetical protein